MDADKAYGEKAGQQLHKNVTCHTEQISGAKSHKTVPIRSPTSHLSNYSNRMNKVQDTAGEVRMSS